MKIKYLTAVACALLLAGCVESYERTTVQGEVVDKEHDEAESYYKTVKDSNGKSKQKLVHEDEEFEVTIRYKDIEKEFEFADDDFYDSVKVGGLVNITLVDGLDKEGKLVYQDIELVE